MWRISIQMTSHNVKSRNCIGKGWHSNAELRERFLRENPNKYTGRTRAFYDAVLTEKQVLGIMKKVMKDIEEPGGMEW